MHFAMFSKAKFLSDHFHYHSATYKSFTCNQEPVYWLFLVPFGKKCNRETPLTIKYLLKECLRWTTLYVLARRDMQTIYPELLVSLAVKVVRVTADLADLLEVLESMSARHNI